MRILKLVGRIPRWRSARREMHERIHNRVANLFSAWDSGRRVLDYHSIMANAAIDCVVEQMLGRKPNARLAALEQLAPFASLKPAWREIKKLGKIIESNAALNEGFRVLVDDVKHSSETILAGAREVVNILSKKDEKYAAFVRKIAGYARMSAGRRELIPGELVSPRPEIMEISAKALCNEMYGKSGPQEVLSFLRFISRVPKLKAAFDSLVDETVQEYQKEKPLEIKS